MIGHAPRRQSPPQGVSRSGDLLRFAWRTDSQREEDGGTRVEISLMNRSGPRLQMRLIIGRKSVAPARRRAAPSKRLAKTQPSDLSESRLARNTVSDGFSIARCRHATAASSPAFFVATVLRVLARSREFPKGSRLNDAAPSPMHGRLVARIPCPGAYVFYARYPRRAAFFPRARNLHDCNTNGGVGAPVSLEVEWFAGTVHFLHAKRPC